MTTNDIQDSEPQANFVESRDPAELIMCIILAAAYAGLAKYLWEPLVRLGDLPLLINVEGFFATVALLALLVGARPHIMPSSLQVSRRGIKYRGPYWPQRKTVNWASVSKLYVSPELVVVLYHPSGQKGKGIWPMFIFSVYLADREKVVDTILEYSPITPIVLSDPSWASRLLSLLVAAIIVIVILQRLIG